MNYNAEIEEIFKNFVVNNELIPVVYLYYNEHKKTYVTYTPTYKDQSYAAEDEIAGYVELYDFDIFSKSNYYDIAEAIKDKLKKAGFTYQPSRDGEDTFEQDTGYFHKTLCFAKERQVTA